MSIALVQSNLCGHATTSTNSVSCTGNFSSNTTAGNFLVAACFVTITLATPTVNPTITTSGVTWTQLGSAVGTQAPALFKGVGFFGIVPNAPSVSSGTNTTFQCGFSGSFGTKTVEFALLEFSGCSQAAFAGGVDAEHSASGASGTPNSGTLSTTGTDLIMGVMVGNSGTITQGAGYTLGPTMTAVTFGQMQYRLNVPAGSISTAWVGSESNWGAYSAAILPQTAVATSNNSYGFFFG